MAPLDRGFRDLLPFLEADPDEFGLVAEEEGERPVQSPGFEPLPVAAESPAPEAMKLPGLAVRDTGDAPLPKQDLPVSSGGAQADQNSGAADGSAITAPSHGGDPQVFESTVAKTSVSGGSGSGGREQGQQSSAAVSDAREDRTSVEGDRPSSDGDGPAGEETLVDEPVDEVEPDGTPPQEVPAAEPGLPVEEEDDGHDITVTQIADVDQDATILVQGYIGPIVARFHVDQSITMDQDADVSIDIDGNGHFAISIDQRMFISQQTELDLNIYDDDGVLYVDLFLRDVIEVDQDTNVVFNFYDGFGENDLQIVQDLVMDQDADVDIDIEDDLEERYTVKVEAVIQQEVDAEQDARLDIEALDEGFEVDVQADQVASIDQETLVKIDFALV
ncbi:hypothetical protein ACFOYU_20825 [Microvirga sp. GCM10011540]|uniref:hypothetical protein n=1 Tax=Microvirga sp. GCM10011540 TaxID=3317338 RepID=UPI00360EA138